MPGDLLLLMNQPCCVDVFEQVEGHFLDSTLFGELWVVVLDLATLGRHSVAVGLLLVKLASQF
jgi:hypothetical protein